MILRLPAHLRRVIATYLILSSSWSSAQMLEFLGPSDLTSRQNNIGQLLAAGKSVNIMWESPFASTTLELLQGPQPDGSYMTIILDPGAAKGIQSFELTPSMLSQNGGSPNFVLSLQNDADPTCPGCAVQSGSFGVSGSASSVSTESGQNGSGSGAVGGAGLMSGMRGSPGQAIASVAAQSFEQIPGASGVASMLMGSGARTAASAAAATESIAANTLFAAHAPAPAAPSASDFSSTTSAPSTSTTLATSTTSSASAVSSTSSAAAAHSDAASNSPSSGGIGLGLPLGLGLGLGIPLLLGILATALVAMRNRRNLAGGHSPRSPGRERGVDMAGHTETGPEVTQLLETGAVRSVHSRVSSIHDSSPRVSMEGNVGAVTPMTTGSRAPRGSLTDVSPVQEMSFHLNEPFSDVAPRSPVTTGGDAAETSNLPRLRIDTTF